MSFRSAGLGDVHLYVLITPGILYRGCGFFFCKQKTAYEICVVSASLRAESWSRLTAYCAATSDETRLGLSIPEPLLSEVRICDVAEAVGLVELVVVIRKPQIGRASCRERVCQYV